MEKVSLAAYVMRVYAHGEKDTPEKIDSFAGGQSLEHLLRGYLEQRKSQHSTDRGEQNILRVRQFAGPEPLAPLPGRLFTGIIETGSYGYEGAIIDAESGKPTYVRKANEAELLPFFFSLQMRPDVDEVLVLLQRLGAKGIQGALLTDFRQYLREHISGYRIDINPLIPPSVAQRLLQGGLVKKLRLVKYEVASDVARRYDVGGHEEKIGTVELVISAKRNSVLQLGDRLSRFLKQNNLPSQFMEVQDFQYDDVKIEVQDGSRSRTVQLGELGKLRPLYFVHDRLQFGSDGHPTYVSLCRAAADLLADFQQLWGD